MAKKAAKGKSRRRPVPAPTEVPEQVDQELPPEEAPDEEAQQDEPAEAEEPAATGTKKKKKKKRTKPGLGIGRIFLQRGPEAFAARITARQAGTTRIAGLDLGTKCGVAFVDILHSLTAAPLIITGQWDLSLGQYDTGPLRHVRLKHFMQVLAPDVVVYENVKYTPSKEESLGSKTGSAGIHAVLARAATAAELIGGLKTTMTVWCEERLVPAHGLSIQEIKQFATGKGNASKVDMIKAVNEKFGFNLDPETYEQTGADNVADAVFCCALGIDLYHEAFP